MTNAPTITVTDLASEIFAWLTVGAICFVVSGGVATILGYESIIDFIIWFEFSCAVSWFTIDRLKNYGVIKNVQEEKRDND